VAGVGAAALSKTEPRTAPSPVNVAPPAAAASGGAATAQKKAHFAPVLPSKDYSPPVLYIDQPKYDFGDVFKGDIVSHRFEIENKGGAPLVIQKVKPSCGCTLLSEATMDKVISPGSKGGFELKIETSRLAPGHQQKYADVSSNDPKQAQFRVFIQGKIDTLLKVDPEQPKIQTVKGKGQGQTEITLTKNTSGEPKVLGAKSQSGRLLVELKEEQPGQRWKLLVKTNYGPQDTQSYFSESIQCEVQLPEKKMTQDVPVTVIVKDRIEINPRSLYFKKSDFQPLKDKGTPTEKMVEVKTILDEPYKFQITNIKIEDPDNFFKVKQETVKDGREYKLVITIDKLPEMPAPAAGAGPAATPQKSMKGNIVLTTDDPNMKEISIRCIAFF
jgi:hypothetical protein